MKLSRLTINLVFCCLFLLLSVSGKSFALTGKTNLKIDDPNVLASPEVGQIVELQALAAHQTNEGLYQKALISREKILALVKKHKPGEAFLADAHFRLANILLEFGDTENANKNLKPAVSYLETISETNEYYYENLVVLGVAYFYLKKNEISETTLLKAIKGLKSKYGNKGLELSAAYLNLANAQLATGKISDSEKHSLKALSLYENIKVENKESREGLIDSLNNLGHFYFTQKKFDKSEGYYFTALKEARAYYPKSHPKIILYLQNSNELYTELNDMNKVSDFNSEILKISEKSLGKNNSVYANALNSLGNTEVELGKNLEAEKYYLESLEIFKNLPSSQLSEGMVCGNLGALYLQVPDYNKAIEYYDCVLEVYESLGAIEVKQLSELEVVHHNLATAYFNLEDYENAFSNYSKKLSFVKSENSNSEDLAETYFQIAYSSAEIGDTSSAISNYQKAVQTYAALGIESQLYLNAVVNLGLLYQSLDQSDDVISNFEKVLAIAKENKNVLVLDLKQQADISNSLAYLFSEKGNPEKVKKYYKLAENSYFKLNQWQSLEQVRANLAIHFSSRKQYKEASEYYQKAIDTSKKSESVGKDFELRVANYKFSLAYALLKQEEFKNAKLNYEESLVIYRKNYQSGHERIKIAENNLEYINQRLDQP